VDKNLGRQPGSAALNTLGQAVLEDGLGDSDEDGAAHGLEELHACRRLRDPLMGDAVLDYKSARLEANADTEACWDLFY